ncbi:hypothetical protein HYU91_02780 [Candidatus Collierbacteria bacterium]|nr:hypothetical protein [Candidatus Collierbacteria bacterium]
MAAQIRKELEVERRFAIFHQKTEDELEKGILMELSDAFDRELAFERRVTALETYLGIQYYLHLQRLGRATDPQEENNEAELVNRFSGVFSDSEHLWQYLYRYCGNSADEYFDRERIKESENWSNLAGEIKRQLLR